MKIPKITVPPRSIGVRGDGADSNMNGDDVVHVHVSRVAEFHSGSALADALEQLARFVRGGHNDLGGDADILILRRKSR